MKSMLLTFDIEEFDLPRENGIKISTADMFKVSREGTEKILNLLKKHNVNATFFVTNAFALENKDLLFRMKNEKHEIAFHGSLHSDNYKEMNLENALLCLKKGKAQIEKMANVKILGFRAPRMMPPEYSVLNECGIRYDSSMHPTWIPGRYNNFFKSRKIKINEGVISIPVSVTPLKRLPFSWLWFRNFGVAYAKLCTLSCFLFGDFVDIYFHPWDFADIEKYKLPCLIKRNAGDKCLKMLEKYILWCKSRKYEFKTMGNYLKLID